MNSWKSRSLGACAPPFTTLKCGTGSRGITPDGVSHRHNGSPDSAANACAAAIDTPTIAFAPNRDLSAVPSNPRRVWSTCSKEANDRPVRVSAIGPLTCATARSTPRPPIAVIVIAQLDGLTATRRRPGRHPRAHPTPAGKRCPHTQCRPTTRIQDLDGRHRRKPHRHFSSSASLARPAPILLHRDRWPSIADARLWRAPPPPLRLPPDMAPHTHMTAAAKQLIGEHQ